MSHHWDGTESRAVGVMTDPVSGRAMSNYDIEKRFASTFGELSFEERDDALNDIHGVADPMDETPEFVSMSLENLTIELDRIESKFAYDIAKSQSVEFVANRDFLMRFLRAERFNEKQAARRMINHFQKKLELFGEGVLAKELKFSDLGHDEVAVIQSGYIRILPLRDRAGRLVLFHARSLHHHMTILTRVRDSISPLSSKRADI